ncbi:ATP-dependent DNA helicase PIF1-like protein [Tanacetum coccineum]|uniref:ATP-dependent DNA helicase PIF1-like protein n=1 Tax=Tanacetum coccineum TaxID=301880 RepID=A0ABQ5G080_9ASTR
MWRIGASRGLLRDLSRGLVALLLRLRSPLGRVHDPRLDYTSLLFQSTTFYCTVKIDNVIPRTAGIFHHVVVKNAGKVLLVQVGTFIVNPVTNMWSTLYRLELEVSDDTGEVGVVMFNETATSMVKCTAGLIVEFDDEDGDEHSPLPHALANIMGTIHTLEFRSHTYYEHNTYKSFTCWRIVTAKGMGESGGSSAADAHPISETPEFKRLLRHPSVATPSKLVEDKKHKRLDLEDFDAEASFVADTQTGSEVDGSRPDTRKNKRYGNITHSCGQFTATKRKQVSLAIGTSAHLASERETLTYTAFTFVSKELQWYLTAVIHMVLSNWHLGSTRPRQNNSALTSNSIYIQLLLLRRRQAKDRGIYTFRVNRRSYHKIRSLLPKQSTHPRYAQLWFFDTENEVRNRMGAFIDKNNGDGVDATTVQSLIQMLDQYSSVAKAFQMARDWCHSHAFVNVELHLLSD